MIFFTLAFLGSEFPKNWLLGRAVIFVSHRESWGFIFPSYGKQHCRGTQNWWGNSVAILNISAFTEICLIVSVDHRGISCKSHLKKSRD